MKRGRAVEMMEEVFHESITRVPPCCLALSACSLLSQERESTTRKETNQEVSYVALVPVSRMYIQKERVYTCNKRSRHLANFQRIRIKT